MATYNKVLLSGGTNGKFIKVAATSTAGTLIHTAVSGTSSMDEIWLYAHNSSAAQVKLTIEWGEATAPDGHMEVNLAAEGTGLVLVSPGILLQNGLEVRAFAGTTNVVTINGYVNRIS